MIVTAAVGLPVYLADNSNPVTTTGEEAFKAGPIAIVVIALLCIACYFLFRSMSRHLRKVRDEFPTGGVPTSGQDGPTARQDEQQPR